MSEVLIFNSVEPLFGCEQSWMLRNVISVTEVCFYQVTHANAVYVFDKISIHIAPRTVPLQ